MAKPFVRVAALQQNQPIVDRDGKPNPFFMRALNDTLGNLGEAINALAALPIIQEQLELVDAKADDAIAIATAANGNSEAVLREQALVNSYIDPATVTTASDTLISVAAHTRYYADADNSSAAINAGTVAATASGTTAYVYYDDPDRIGGDVTFQTSLTQPIQTGDRHVIEAINIPNPGDPETGGGGGPRPPGYVVPPPL